MGGIQLYIGIMETKMDAPFNSEFTISDEGPDIVVGTSKSGRFWGVSS